MQAVAAAPKPTTHEPASRSRSPRDVHPVDRGGLQSPDRTITGPAPRRNRPCPCPQAHATRGDRGSCRNSSRKLRSVIEAKVSGKIDQMLVVPGQTVKAGDLLAEFDAREVQARLDQALAVRQQAESDLKRTESLAREQNSRNRNRQRAGQDPCGRCRGEGSRNPFGLHESCCPVRRRRHAQACGRGRSRRAGKPLLEMEDARALRLEADVPEAVWALTWETNSRSASPALEQRTRRRGQ